MNRDDGEVDKVQSRERAAIGRTFLRRQMGGPATLEESAEKLKGLKLHRQAGRWDCPNEVSCPSACLAFRWSLSPFMFFPDSGTESGTPICCRRIRFSDTGFFLFPKVYLSFPAASESLRQTQICLFGRHKPENFSCYIGNRHCLEPHAPWSGDHRIKQPLAAKHHVLKPRNFLDLHTA